MKHLGFVAFSLSIKLTVQRPIITYLQQESKTFGEKLKKARIKLGYSKVQVAQIIGVTKSTIVQWENDFHKPRDKSIAAIEEFIFKSNSL